MFRVLVTLFTILIAQNSMGQIRLPAIFSNNMVLQQKEKVALWGWGAPSEEISIHPSWDTLTTKVTVNNFGKWMTRIQTPSAGGPYTLTLKGSSEIILKDILIGEVWICSGQSNMEWSVYNGSEDAKQARPQANHPTIRLYHVVRSGADQPQERGEGNWEACTPETMARFSSVGYFFGKKLQENLNVPIGLINASWGGTPGEVWVPEEFITNDVELKEAATKQEPRIWWPQKPGATYNAMINPLVPFNVAGVIWYQGESNTVYPRTYSKLMDTLVSSWRTAFEKDISFYYVQIAPFKGYQNNSGVLIREQQTIAASEIKNSGMIIISDHVDNIEDIHPTYKKPVGDRLANYALAKTYRMENIVYQYPVYKSMAIEKKSIRLTFDHAEKGFLKSSSQFTIAGGDKIFYPAKVKIEGNTIIVSAKEVKSPVAVRYAWDDSIIGDFFSSNGLPVSCFRTDNWEK